MGQGRVKTADPKIAAAEKLVQEDRERREAKAAERAAKEARAKIQVTLSAADLELAIGELDGVHDEIIRCNPNIRPIRFVTKDRWRDSVARVAAILRAALPVVEEEPPTAPEDTDVVEEEPAAEAG